MHASIRASILVFLAHAAPAAAERLPEYDLVDLLLMAVERIPEVVIAIGVEFERAFGERPARATGPIAVAHARARAGRHLEIEVYCVRAAAPRATLIATTRRGVDVALPATLSVHCDQSWISPPAGPPGPIPPGAYELVVELVDGGRTTRLPLGTMVAARGGRLTLIPGLSPSDLTYLRVDPIAHDRLRLVVRNYDRPRTEMLRELQRAGFERTTQQDVAVVQRTFRGLHAHGLPAGVHASRLEARIGHLERMWADAMVRAA